jgi:hypothetical protein
MIDRDNSALSVDRRSERRASTPGKRSKRERETLEIRSMVRRMFRAYRRRVSKGDIEELPGMVELHTDLDKEIQAAVDGLREFGYSWTEIADRMKITRQAARQRWGVDR